MPTSKIVEVMAALPEIYKGKFDKTGAEYWTHPQRVAELLPTDVSVDVVVAALLHDVYEDTDFDPETLGISEDALEMIKLLTRKDNESYSEYVERIVASGNRGAILVKYADLYHNLQPGRIMALGDKTRKRLLDKYVPALQVIAQALA